MSIRLAASVGRCIRSIRTFATCTSANMPGYEKGQSIATRMKNFLLWRTMERKLAFVGISVLIFWFYLNGSIINNEFGIREISFEKVNNQFTLKRNGKVVLSGQIGKKFNFSEKFNPQPCEVPGLGSTSCLVSESAKYLLSKENVQDPETECYNVYWKARSSHGTQVPLDCFDVKDNHWYGGPELWKQRWTIEKHDKGMQQYLSWDNGFNKYGYGSVMERYWLSSNGVAIWVYDDSPLHFGFVSSQLCLKADYSNSWYNNSAKKPPVLHYTVCAGNDVKAVHTYMAKRFIPKPTGIPEEAIFRYPIWSSWARYKEAVNQEKVLQYAQEIRDHGFHACQVEIDDVYTPTYGDHTFDLKKFPEPKQMIDKIHNLGFKVTSWVHPFMNIDSMAFQEGVKKNYFVMDQNGLSSLVKWWQGIGGLLDVTNPEAVKWFFDRLSHLQSIGMDSFKFDAGECNFLPPNFKTKNTIANPNHYGRLYAEAAHNYIGKGIEVRVGYKSQQLPVFVRMMDKESSWDYDRALKTVIPNALQFGIIGYPFLLPDMIGGNGYDSTANVAIDGVVSGARPSKELFIRWLELNVFLPSMQYSFAPWQYDNETVKIAKTMTELHETYVTDIILKLAQNSVLTGEPIIRPLWWIDPVNSKTFDIEDEFLVGNDLLVAPILNKGATKRDVYLPTGKWKDKLRGDTLSGEQTLRDYKIDLHEIAYFERIVI